MKLSPTASGTIIAAVLALTWMILGFWSCLWLAIAMGLGAVIARALAGEIHVRSVVDAMRGKRTSS